MEPKWRSNCDPTGEVVVAIPHQLEVALVWDPCKITITGMYIHICIYTLLHYIYNRNATRQTMAKPPLVTTLSKYGDGLYHWLILG